MSTSSWPSLRPEDGLGDALRRLLADVPCDVVRAVEEMGIQTPSDFHRCWNSSQSCFAELEAKTGRHLSSQEAMKVAVAWTTARRESGKAVDHLGKVVAQERMSSVSVSAPTFPAAPAAPEALPSSSSRVRRLFPTGLPILWSFNV